MVKQSALTLVTPVTPGKHDELNEALMSIRAELSSGKFKEFEKINTLHYARFVLLEDCKLSTAKTNLVFSSDYDGNESEHLILLTQKCADLIDRLYSCCDGYPSAGQRTTESRVAYLNKWSNKDSAFYIGAPGRSLQQILQENKLRNYLWDYLRKGKWEGKSAKEVHNIVRSHIATLPEFSWSKEKVPLPKIKVGNFVLLIVLALVLFPLTILFAIVAGIWLLVLHFGHEKSDKPLGMTPSQIDDKFITNLEGYEDFHNQNQFTQIIPMKPGKMRLITINAVLLYGKFRILNEFLKGELMGIPTIHFARWVMLDNNKQVLFFSNFDGSWQQYLGDFIDKSGWGLTGIFSNTENFPNTRYLFWGGAYDEEHFLAWSRYYQIPTQVWYCAYPKLSIKNINTNSLIRSELIQDLDEQQAQTFLNRF